MDDEPGQALSSGLTVVLDGREIAAAAILTGSFAGVLAEDVVVTTDGLELAGRDDCALFLAGLVARLDPDSVETQSVNGEPGLALRRGITVVAVAVAHARDGYIGRLWLVSEPAKLRSWN